MIDHCIIHIGTHKTGSSSIQDTLFRELSDPAFEYAKLGRSNHSTFIQHAFFTNPENHINLRNRDLTDSEVMKVFLRARRKIKRAIGEAAAPTVIFSGEGICLLNEAELERFRAFIAGQFAKFQWSAMSGNRKVICRALTKSGSSPDFCDSILTGYICRTG